MMCDCESESCAAELHHPFAACAGTELRRIVAFGYKQTLCANCIQFAKTQYGENIQEEAAPEPGAELPLAARKNWA